MGRAGYSPYSMYIRRIRAVIEAILKHFSQYHTCLLISEATEKPGTKTRRHKVSGQEDEKKGEMSTEP